MTAADARFYLISHLSLGPLRKTPKLRLPLGTTHTGGLDCLFHLVFNASGTRECITAALQPVEYLQKYSRVQTTESASDEMTYKLVKFHGTKEG